MRWLMADPNKNVPRKSEEEKSSIYRSSTSRKENHVHQLSEATSSVTVNDADSQLEAEFKQFCVNYKIDMTAIQADDLPPASSQQQSEQQSYKDDGWYLTYKDELFKNYKKYIKSLGEKEPAERAFREQLAGDLNYFREQLIKLLFFIERMYKDSDGALNADDLEPIFQQYYKNLNAVFNKYGVLGGEEILPLIDFLISNSFGDSSNKAYQEFPLILEACQKADQEYSLVGNLSNTLAIGFSANLYLNTFKIHKIKKNTDKVESLSYSLSNEVNSIHKTQFQNKINWLKNKGLEQLANLLKPTYQYLRDNAQDKEGWINFTENIRRLIGVNDVKSLRDYLFSGESANLTDEDYKTLYLEVEARAQQAYQFAEKHLPQDDNKKPEKWQSFKRVVKQMEAEFLNELPLPTVESVIAEPQAYHPECVQRVINQSAQKEDKSQLNQLLGSKGIVKQLLLGNNKEQISEVSNTLKQLDSQNETNYATEFHKHVFQRLISDTHNCPKSIEWFVEQDITNNEQRQQIIKSEGIVKQLLLKDDKQLLNSFNTMLKRLDSQNETNYATEFNKQVFQHLISDTHNCPKSIEWFVEQDVAASKQSHRKITNSYKQPRYSSQLLKQKSVAESFKSDLNAASNVVHQTRGTTAHSNAVASAIKTCHESKNLPEQLKMIRDLFKRRGWFGQKSPDIDAIKDDKQSIATVVNTLVRLANSGYNEAHTYLKRMLKPGVLGLRSNWLSGSLFSNKFTETLLGRNSGPTANKVISFVHQLKDAKSDLLGSLWKQGLNFSEFIEQKLPTSQVELENSQLENTKHLIGKAANKVNDVKCLIVDVPKIKTFYKKNTEAKRELMKDVNQSITQAFDAIYNNLQQAYDDGNVSDQKAYIGLFRQLLKQTHQVIYPKQPDQGEHYSPNHDVLSQWQIDFARNNSSDAYMRSITQFDDLLENIYEDQAQHLNASTEYRVFKAQKPAASQKIQITLHNINFLASKSNYLDTDPKKAQELLRIGIANICLDQFIIPNRQSELRKAKKQGKLQKKFTELGEQALDKADTQIQHNCRREDRSQEDRDNLARFLRQEKQKGESQHEAEEGQQQADYRDEETKTADDSQLPQDVELNQQNSKAEDKTDKTDENELGDYDHDVRKLSIDTSFFKSFNMIYVGDAKQGNSERPCQSQHEIDNLKNRKT